MPKTIEEYKQLDNEHKGTQNDFDERLKVTYYIDKHHRVKAILDIYSGMLTIGESSILWSKQGGIA